MDIDTKQLHALQKRIAELSERGIPIAVQQTLTNTARNAWRYGRQNIDREFQLRNAWTRRSTSYQPAEGLNVDSMVARTGSSAEYMAEQEDGFNRQGKGDNGVWVPTADAADQSGTRTKPVKYKFRRGKIRLRRKTINGSRGHKKAKSAKQQRFFNIYNAVTGNGYFWGTLNGTNGMWYMAGSVAKGRIVLTGVRLLYSANKKSIRTDPHIWHETATTQAVEIDMGNEYFKALERQVRRLERKYK